MVLNATFNNILVYCGGQIFWWGETEELGENTHPPPSTDKHYQIIFPSLGYDNVESV
jgi:hypothetical protein